MCRTVMTSIWEDLQVKGMNTCDLPGCAAHAQGLGSSLEYSCSVVVGGAEEADAIHLQYLVTHLAAKQHTNCLTCFS